jgi:hypothetical protein
MMVRVKAIGNATNTTEIITRNGDAIIRICEVDGVHGSGSKPNLLRRVLRGIRCDFEGDVLVDDCEGGSR